MAERSVRLLVVGFVACSLSTLRAGDLQYNRDIRPILSEMCFRCHGPDSAARKADLRLDLRDAAIQSGAITVGKPDDSELVKRLYSTDPEQVMPPPSPHKGMTDGQKELLKRWIAEGAEYQPHWSFIAPVRPAVPAVKDASWPKNPIDSFILARIEAAGLTPTPEADRHTLARRLSLDLRGLPPTPEEVNEFVNDSSPDAYEAYVDRLLASKHWGEHRGRYWLDAARYADTHGIHFDNFREMWSYRDWVINAFNQNVPFDRFTIEQLAGDLLPERTLDQQVASGFNRCNMTTNEGGVIPEEYAVLYARDRTETTAQVWMGLTANCATCHDHKYDPLSQKEFYELSAFFNNTTQNPMDGNIKDTPPIVIVPQPDDREKYAKLGGEIGEAKQKTEAHVASCKPEFEKWQGETKPETVAAMVPTDSLSFLAPLSDGTDKLVKVKLSGEDREITMGSPITWEAGYAAPKALKTRPEYSVEVPEAGNFDTNQPFSCGVWVKLPKEGMTGALVARMDESSAYRGWDLWVQNNRFGSHIVHEWPGDALKVVSKQELKPGIWYHLLLTYDGGGQLGGVKLYVNGSLQETDVEARQLKGSIKTAVGLKVAQRNTTARLDDIVIQDLRIYSKTLSSSEVSQVAGSTRASYLVGKPKAERSDQETEELFRWWLPVLDKTYQELNARSEALQAEKAAIEGRATIAHVMQEKQDPAMAYVLYRGEYDKRRDKVTPTTPTVLPAMAADLPRTRLGLAKWLLQPEHPLTARVTVNRFWQEVFGAGIVRTTGDLGMMGELPSHPELIDWLAIEFRESGWDVKKFFKMLVMSATYRQSAVATQEKIEKDPANRLLARGPRFRMDAEMIRDYALASSGLLSEKIGGPSVKPYQPEGVWEAVAMIGSNTRDYKQDSGDSLYRRSMYTFWKRAAPPASMDIFNAPNREVCTVRRERTNTPLQALVTLNDPQFVEAARVLAERTIKQAGDSDDAKIDFITNRLLSRSLRDEERPVVRQSFADLSAYYLSHPDDAKKLIAVGESKADSSVDVIKLASWTMLINELMNLDEVLCK
ncbi:DUF1553 domain-containing protein [bacterium]|nr:DUF1553 domain-containing protein [bacterium]